MNQMNPVPFWGSKTLFSVSEKILNETLWEILWPEMPFYKIKQEFTLLNRNLRFWMELYCTEQKMI